MRKMRKLQVHTILRAIKKNGYKKGLRNYHSDWDDTYCSLGQAAMNLGFGDPSAVGSALHYENGPLGQNLYEAITNLNDETDMTLPQIAERVSEMFKDNLKDIIVIK